ncbi:putative MATE family efflux protein [Dysgonomonas sp. PH5-45]|uniref:MATE family efflux transporter n=1 Tax=unclassified Dysgonomonas TaxID=2630389 RepID=UPI0024766646|nr:MULTISPECIES: MATE family efflux transporter [unclassified Dysgonomonas]MDH6353802.1 putative MATE family efflux protein [Dysgonomonas sp. PH5-45]MDH6386704.1 putative MATE family efflux protein [Dysgonomonas sp. PH5-37]
MAKGVLDLTNGKILSNLLRVAFPLMGTSFVQMSYTLLSMTWVGRLGSRHEAAIGAIGMLLWLSYTFAVLAMIGVEVSVGQAIGAKRMGRARNFASNASTLAIGIGVLWTLLLAVFAPQILSFFKLEADITAEAVNYLRILAICLPFQFLSVNWGGVYNGAGRSIVPFKINTLGLVLNMVLDPILMFYFGFGFYGAAIGTVVAQLFVFGLFVFNIRYKNDVLGYFSFIVAPKWVYLKRLLFLGAPVSAMNSLYAFINMSLARAASTYGGHIGLMSQTTGGQIEGITWNTSQGFSTALSAFMAQNYAAGKPERGRKAYIYALRIMVSLGIFVSITFIFFGKQIFGIIVPEEEAMIGGGRYLAIMGLVQIFMMFELTTQGMFNGVGRTIEPAVISITFNILRIPMAYLFASPQGLNLGIEGVWWAIAVSTVCKGTILPIWFMFVYRRIKIKLNK